MNKFCMIIEDDNRAKVFINEEELHRVCEIEVHGEPHSFDISITQHATKDNGSFVVENDMIKRVVTEYHIGEF